MTNTADSLVVAGDCLAQVGRCFGQGCKGNRFRSFAQKKSCFLLMRASKNITLASARSWKQRIPVRPEMPCTRTTTKIFELEMGDADKLGGIVDTHLAEC